MICSVVPDIDAPQRNSPHPCSHGDKTELQHVFGFLHCICHGSIVGYCVRRGEPMYLIWIELPDPVLYSIPELLTPWL